MSAARLEAAEVTGYRDHWNAAPAALASHLGLAHAEVGGAHATAAAAVPGVRLLNHALGLADGPLRDEDLDAVESFYGERGLPALVALRAGARGEAQLSARGYERDYAWVKFARDAAPAPAPGCELAVRTVPEADAARMGHILTSSFGLPGELGAWFAALVGRAGWNVLGAYDGADLVATATLWVHGHAGWLTWAATDASHRGRRAQRALLAARIELARRLGLDLLVVETGEQVAGRPDASYRNILWAGFEPAYVRPFWRRAA